MSTKFQPYAQDNPVLGFCQHRKDKYPAEFAFLATFSNWSQEHDSGKDYQFQLDGLNFDCVERQMMWEKALTFGDQQTADKIMAAQDPKECKTLGRQVKGYDDQVWDAVRKEKVKRGIKAKFSQNSGLRDNLLQTQGKILAEAAWYDEIWGIGLRATDPRTQTPPQWLGRNLLGECLMEVRDELIEANQS